MHFTKLLSLRGLVRVLILSGFQYEDKTKVGRPKGSNDKGPRAPKRPRSTVLNDTAHTNGLNSEEIDTSCAYTGAERGSIFFPRMLADSCTEIPLDKGQCNFNPDDYMDFSRLNASAQELRERDPFHFDWPYWNAASN